MGFVVLLPSTQAQSVEAERARIEGKRQQLRDALAIDETACQQRFAVNSCLNEINSKRRDEMADLRRQEISLNDDERRKRGAEQIRRVEEKLSVSNRQKSVDRRAQMFSEYEVRANRERKVRKVKEERTQAENRLPHSSVAATMRKKQLSMDKPPNSDVVRDDQYVDRQNQVRERRFKHEATVSKRPPSTAKSLPVPP